MFTLYLRVSNECTLIYISVLIICAEKWFVVHQLFFRSSLKLIFVSYSRASEYTEACTYSFLQAEESTNLSIYSRQYWFPVLRCASLPKQFWKCEDHIINFPSRQNFFNFNIMTAPTKDVQKNGAKFRFEKQVKHEDSRTMEYSKVM